MATNGQEYKICIDRDEEIMDAVDRLRRTPVRDVTLVVPQHAMLLHSGVNLKILAYEARRMDKNITIMTNDEEGATLAQRAQIATAPYRGDDTVQQASYVRPPQKPSAPVAEAGTMRAPRQPQPQQQSHPQPQQQPLRPVSMPSQGMSAAASQQPSPVRPSAPSQFTRPSATQRRTLQAPASPHSPRRPQSPQPTHTSLHARSENARPLPPQRRMHRAPASAAPSHPSSHNDDPHLPSRKPRIVAWGLAVAAIIVLIVVGLMVILPQSHVAVFPRRITIDEKVDVSARVAQTSMDAERRMIPARVIDRDVTFTKTFPATGSGNADAQKARGKIIITNTDASAQPLVATTRFVAENGSLFRLVNAVTVPGKRDDTPGTVEALVVADKAGTEGNIEPTTFRVPGLEGTAKADKVTAQSTAPMTGGGSGGNGVALVTQEDLVQAKTVTEQETHADVETQIAALTRPDAEVLLSGALQMTQKQSEADVTAGTAQAEFHYTTVTHVRAIVFAKDDVHTTVRAAFADRVASYGISDAQFTMTYNDGDADFDAETVKMEVRAALDVASHVDLSAFKHDIIGKKHDELYDIIEKNYATTIDKITISHVIPTAPAFIANRISPVGFMTSVDIAEEKR